MTLGHPYVSHMVELLTLNFSLGHDLRVIGLSPALGPVLGV